jgi:type II secretory pathway pseudopilin PulG
MVKNEKGFTVVEIVLVMSLVSLLLVPIGSLFLSNIRSSISTSENSNLQDKAQQIMQAFRTDCLYASRISTCKINGTPSMDAGSTNGNSFVITLVHPTSTGEAEETYIYERDDANNTYVFTKKDGGVSGRTELTVDNVKVTVTPVVKRSEPNEIFQNAAGINVEVSLSKEITSIKRKTQLLELSNAFYFRNSGVDINDLSRTPTPENAPMPTPVNITSSNYTSPSPTSASGGSGSSGDSGDSSDSGGSGSSGDSGDSGSGGSSGDSGDSGDSGSSSSTASPTVTTSPTVAPTTAPTTAPTPTPTPKPTATPTPKPTVAPTVAPSGDKIYLIVGKNNDWDYPWSLRDASGSVIQSGNHYNWLTFLGNQSFGSATVERDSNGYIKSVDIYITADSTLPADANVSIGIQLQDWGNPWIANSVITIHNLITDRPNAYINCYNYSSKATMLVDDAQTRPNGVEKTVSSGSSYSSQCN